MKKFIGVLFVLVVFSLSACQNDSTEKQNQESTTKQTSAAQETSSSLDKGSAMDMKGKLQKLYNKNNSEDYDTVWFYASEKHEKNYLIAFISENENGSAEQIKVVTSKGGNYHLDTDDMDVQVEGESDDEVFSLPDTQSMVQFSVKHKYYEEIDGEPFERYYYYLYDITEDKARHTNTERSVGEYNEDFVLKGVQCKNNKADVEKCLNENF